MAFSSGLEQLQSLIEQVIRYPEIRLLDAGEGLRKVEKPSICGFSVYVANSPSSGSVTAASAIAGRITQAGITSCGSQPHRAGYRVLVHNSRPAVLLEMGFVTNLADAGRLRQDPYRRTLADAVADGVADYLSRR